MHGMQEKLFHIWLNSFFVAGGERGELKFEHHTSSRSASDGDMDGAMNRASAPMSDSSRMLLQGTRGENGQGGHSPQQSLRQPGATPGEPTASPSNARHSNSNSNAHAQAVGVGSASASANHQCPVCQMELVAPAECELAACETCGSGNRSSPTAAPSAAPAATASWPFVGSQTALSTDVPVAAASRSPDVQLFPQRRAERSSDILLDFFKCDLDRAHKDRNDKTLPRNFQVRVPVPVRAHCLLLPLSSPLRSSRAASRRTRTRAQTQTQTQTPTHAPRAHVLSRRADALLTPPLTPHSCFLLLAALCAQDTSAICVALLPSASLLPLVAEPHVYACDGQQACKRYC